MRSAHLGLAILILGVLLSGCGDIRDPSVPLCLGPGRSASALILMAQSVPSAAYVPCVSEFPAGWTFGGERIRNGRSELWMDSDRAGAHAVTVVLAADCDTSGAVEVPQETGEPLMKRYEEPNALPPTFSGNRYYVQIAGRVFAQTDKGQLRPVRRKRQPVVSIRVLCI